SSRRRHTRSYGDWSSDVCSSDLSLDDGFPPGIVRSIEPLEQAIVKDPAFAPAYAALATAYAYRSVQFPLEHPPAELLTMRTAARSEERRVGKEGRSRRRRQRAYE